MTSKFTVLTKSPKDKSALDSFLERTTLFDFSLFYFIAGFAAY